MLNRRSFIGSVVAGIAGLLAWLSGWFAPKSAMRTKTVRWKVHTGRWLDDGWNAEMVEADVVVTGYDGEPAPLWFVRHTRPVRKDYGPVGRHTFYFLPASMEAPVISRPVNGQIVKCDCMFGDFDSGERITQFASVSGGCHNFGKQYANAGNLEDIEKQYDMTPGSCSPERSEYLQWVKDLKRKERNRHDVEAVDLAEFVRECKAMS